MRAQLSSFMTSFQSLKNGEQFLVNGKEYVKIEAMSAASGYFYNAVGNGLELTWVDSDLSVERSNPSVMVGDVKIGEPFVHNGSLYLKVAGGAAYDAVAIPGGHSFTFHQDDLVYIVKDMSVTV